MLHPKQEEDMLKYPHPTDTGHTEIIGAIIGQWRPESLNEENEEEIGSFLMEDD